MFLQVTLAGLLEYLLLLCRPKRRMLWRLSVLEFQGVLSEQTVQIPPAGLLLCFLLRVFVTNITSRRIVRL